VADDLQFEAMLIDIERYESICLDTETTGLDPFSAKLVGISLAVREHEAYYVVLPLDNPEVARHRLDKLKPLLENNKIKKIGQNLKFDYMVLRNNDVRLRGVFLDTMIMHYLINPESRHNMDFLAKTYLNYSPIPIEDIIGRGTKQLSMEMVSTDKVGNYSAEDADITLQLYGVLWNELSKLGLDSLYLDVEEPLISVLGDIELNGVKLDAAVLRDYEVQLEYRIAVLESEIRMMADLPTLNINSSKQLGEILFEKLQLDPKPKRTKTKQYSTDEEYLQSLSDKHPIIELILEYRGLRKLMNTYVTALPQMINPVTGRIHTSFNQAVTATGRLSSTDPNLQNIPVRDDDGREIRKAFVPSDAEHVLVAADYSQVELRIMASLSGDQELISAFLQDKDIHTSTAAKIYHTQESEVSREQRRRAKTANFGIIYGISVFGLSQRLAIPRSEAKSLIDGYFSTYPGVREYMESAISQAKQSGFVTTIFGRRRLLPDINSGNATVRGLAERNAVNAPIQGSAADIMKIAMVRVARRFDQENLKSKLILQVHDELIVDALKSELPRVEQILKTEMESAAKLAVPLTVEVGVGENWLDAH
jgi:DNA polymerase-1